MMLIGLDSSSIGLVISLGHPCDTLTRVKHPPGLKALFMTASALSLLFFAACLGVSLAHKSVLGTGLSLFGVGKSRQALWRLKDV
jgi:hypothetical protein